MMESLIRASDGQSVIEGIIPHLADFLLQTTPAIDSNDVPKTQHALKLYYAFLLHVPLFDNENSSSGTNILSDHNSSTMNTTLLKERQIVSAVFHDWALEWLDRTFNFVSIPPTSLHFFSCISVYTSINNIYTQTQIRAHLSFFVSFSY
jgi:hypothetical protein